MKRHKRDMELVGPWRKLHGAVWLIGLVILIWQGWMWPGILVLIAISTLIEALLMQFVPQASEQTDLITSPSSVLPSSMAAAVLEHRPEFLPSSCPKCGAPVRRDEVKWMGPQSADCSYCGANLPMRKD
jgi:hypothetical protein